MQGSDKESFDKSIDYHGARIFYRRIGTCSDGKVPLLFLHGWGGNANSFAIISPFFEKFFSCIYISLPCFNKNDENSPNFPFTILDYACVIEQVLLKEGVSRTYVIAHSFGARLVAVLSARNKGLFEKVVITGGAGLKSRSRIIVKAKIMFYKITKRIFKRRRICGSRDYRALSHAGKLTFQNILTYDIKDKIAHITAPTLVINGSRDKSTPLYMAKKWTKLCVCAKLVIYKSRGHFCYLEQPTRFILDCQKFFAF